MSATKRGAVSSPSIADNKKQKRKKLRLSASVELSNESSNNNNNAGAEDGLYEDSAEGSHLDDEIQLPPASNQKGGAWDWNRCFVLECRRVSDRYLKDMKDRNVVSVHTCASHRTMQEKAKKSFKGRESQIPCHICFGMNFGSANNEIFTCGAVPGYIDNFLICKTCRYIQDRIMPECVSDPAKLDKLKARSYHIDDAQKIKRALWEKLTANITKCDPSTLPVPISLPPDAAEEPGGEDPVEEDEEIDKTEEKRAPSTPITTRVSTLKQQQTISSPSRDIPAGSSGDGFRLSHGPDPEAEATQQSSLRDLIILAIEANWPELRRGGAIPPSSSGSKIKISLSSGALVTNREQLTSPSSTTTGTSFVAAAPPIGAGKLNDDESFGAEFPQEPA